jgi:hypothetical protein
MASSSVTAEASCPSVIGVVLPQLEPEADLDSLGVEGGWRYTLPRRTCKSAALG